MEDKLLHPNLLHNDELVSIIKERKLVENFDGLSRNELMEIFKRHVMPKPQRRQKCESGSNITSNETINLTKEVKRIKLSRVNNEIQPMDCSPSVGDCDSGHKRSIANSPQSSSLKRQKIQWP